MDGEFTTPQWRPEPEPSNALERLMAKAAADPAYHGPMMRALWEAEIHTLMPYHPEMEGTHQYQPGQQMQFIVVKDQVGPFIPAFTSEATADYCLKKNAPKNARYALASFQGELFFPLIKSLNQTVVFNSGMERNLVIKPEAIHRLVSGEFRHSRPSHGPGELTHLYHLEHDSLPAEFTQSIRSFCDRNRCPSPSMSSSLGTLRRANLRWAASASSCAFAMRIMTSTTTSPSWLANWSPKGSTSLRQSSPIPTSKRSNSSTGQSPFGPF